MLDRLILAVGLSLLGLLAYWLYTQFQLRRQDGRSLGIPGYQAGQATILYFTTPNCAPCRTIQKPALEEIERSFGKQVNILQFDATQQMTLADSWGVLSVPTTFIIDHQGRPRGVNHGPARASKLTTQLSKIGVEPVTDQPAKQTRLATSQEG